MFNTEMKSNLLEMYNVGRNLGSDTEVRNLGSDKEVRNLGSDEVLLKIDYFVIDYFYSKCLNSLMVII